MAIPFHFTAKRRCRLYFLLPSVVSPNTSHIQQGSLHHTVQAFTCLLVCDTFKINWRFSEGTKVRSKHFFLVMSYVFLCYISIIFGLRAKLIKIRQTDEQKIVNILFCVQIWPTAKCVPVCYFPVRHLSLSHLPHITS